MKVNLKGYQGKVKKSATVYSNDPRNPSLLLSIHGSVRALIELQPTNIISFRGMADRQEEINIDIVTNSEPFHVKKVESSLNDKIAYRLETIEEGRRYRLKVSNLVKQGNYSGYIKCYTNMAKKSEIIIPVNAFIEGEIAVRPLSIRVGRLIPKLPVLMGKVLVVNNLQKPFKITKLSYDESLVHVEQQALPNEPGYVLEVSPNLDNMPSGVRLQNTFLVIETDVNKAEKFQVRVEVVKSADPADAQSSSIPNMEESPSSMGKNSLPGKAIRK